MTFAILGMPSVSAAGLLISIDALNQSGGSGSFELLLTNTEAPGGTTYDVAGFSFRLDATGSDLMFTAADYPTGIPPYIFDGTGQTSLDPSIPLSTDMLPDLIVTGGDSEFTSISGLPVNPGDVFSLALISFTSPVPVTVGGLESLIDTTGTVLSEANAQPIPYSLPNAAVPEPSSVVMLGLGAAGLMGVMRRSRRTS